MINIFTQGDTKHYSKVVSENEIAQFDSGTVHEVYSTFSLARDAEWCGRLFVLDMLEAHEQGIGTHISITHHSPAFVGEQVSFIATFEGINTNGEIINNFEATCNGRLIANGTQGQRILPIAKINSIFSKLKDSH
jgi:fluoroacetyl-CoA thioesterase